MDLNATSGQARSNGDDDDPTSDNNVSLMAFYGLGQLNLDTVGSLPDTYQPSASKDRVKMTIPEGTKYVSCRMLPVSPSCSLANTVGALVG